MILRNIFCAWSGTTSLLMSSVRSVESLSLAVPSLSHTVMKSLQRLQLEFLTQDLLLFSLIALMTSLYCSSSALQSCISLRNRSLAILSWYLLMTCAAQTCASMVTSFQKSSVIHGLCCLLSSSQSGFLDKKSTSSLPFPGTYSTKKFIGMLIQQCQISCLICH